MEKDLLKKIINLMKNLSNLPEVFTNLTMKEKKLNWQLTMLSDQI